MQARLVGFVDLARFLTPAEVDTILGFPFHDNYSRFVFGSWRNCVLWNGSGADGDCDLHEYEGTARPTALGGQLPGVQAILRTCFEMEHVKWVRVFVQDHGVLLPHVDFIGMQDGFTRLHLPLRTEPRCMHSEVDEVYHMRAGEVWYVEAARVHSAANLSGMSRVSLCFDFTPGVPIEALVRPPFREAGARIAPHMVELPPLDDQERQAMHALARTLDHENFREVVARLIRIHFEKRAPAAAMFDWLSELATASGDPALVQRAREIHQLALG